MSLSWRKTGAKVWTSEPLILEPEGAAILRGAKENVHFFQTSTATPAGQKLGELRMRCRREVQELLRPSCDLAEGRAGLPDAEKPWIFTGHQAEFFHGGILAKYLLADCLARRLSGQVFNLVVDQDVPEKAFLSVPREQGDSLSVESIPFAISNPELPMEYQPAPSSSELSSLVSRFPPESGDIPGHLSLSSLFETLLASAAQSRSLSDFFLRVNHHFARSVSIDWLDLPVSRLSETPTFYSFAADWIRNASRVQGLYNEALHRYRAEKAIRNNKQPLANLEQRGNRTELPFWIFRANQPRLPLFSESLDDSIAVYEGESPLARISFRRQADFEGDGTALRNALESGGRHIRPRAAALTLFVRVLLADTFIHGLGGRRYEAINETLIGEYYGIRPPAWAVASANLYFPFGNPRPQPEQIQEGIDSLQRTLGDLTSHPERYLNELEDPEVAEGLIEEKNRLIETDRRLRLDRAPSPERRETFQRLRQINEEIAAAFSPFCARVRGRMETEQRRLSSARVAHHREFFFGLFPRETLWDLKNLIDNRIPKD